jgi:2-iminoacetate synthase
VALGVLFGLYDWRYDVLALIEHASFLRKVYGIDPYAIGIPRLKPALGVPASQKRSRFSVGDQDYRLAVSLYHLAFPRTRLFFNTRESYEFNLSMVEGGDLFTVDCETSPGGYQRGHSPGQFSTHRYPSRREVAATFERRNFFCRYVAPQSETPKVAAPGGQRPD